MPKGQNKSRSFQRRSRIRGRANKLGGTLPEDERLRQFMRGARKDAREKAAGAVTHRAQGRGGA